MSNELIEWERFPEDVSRVRILRLTAEQINKDSGEQLFNTEQLAEETSAEMLLTTVTQWLAELQRAAPERLVQLFYRVDVPEPHVQAVLRQQPPEEVPRHLGVLLIQREVQKVYWRLKYRTL
jgi:hypothetical protein